VVSINPHVGFGKTGSVMVLSPGSFRTLILGKPLSESERIYFELRFGVDFGQVRVHTDA